MNATDNCADKTFLAKDRHGAEYEIKVVDESHNKPAITTVVGQTVEYLEKGKYRIVGFQFIELFCDDPDAP